MAKKEVYDDMNQSPVGPDEGPMRMRSGTMGLSTAPSDTYANTCLGEMNEDSNPHILDRSQERMPVRGCPGVDESCLKGYVSKVKAGLRPTYKPHPTQK